MSQLDNSGDVSKLAESRLAMPLLIKKESTVTDIMQILHLVFKHAGIISLHRDSGSHQCVIFMAIDHGAAT